MTLADVPALQALIAASARAFGRPDYTEAQIEAALGTAWGVDTELVRDGTYFVVEVDGAQAFAPQSSWRRFPASACTAPSAT